MELVSVLEHNDYIVETIASFVLDQHSGRAIVTSADVELAHVLVLS